MNFKMFRRIQDIQPQKFLLDKFLHSIQWTPKPPAPAKIAVTPTRSTIDPTVKDFKGENVVITSGAGPLGRALAIKFGRLNATVAIWDSNKEGLDDTAKLVKVVGGRVFSYVCDLTRKEDIYRIAEKTRRDMGQITIVVNNGDAASEKLFLDTPDFLIERAFSINVLSHFWTTKAFLPNMIDANKGHIVTISSMAGHMGIQKLTDYCATKAAAVSFLSALKTELEREGSKGIKTTIICPYFMKSTQGQKDAELRLVPALNPELVADRTINAIKAQEDVVFIPGWFKFAMLPKWITPSSISSLLIRLLIKDPSPSAVQSTPVKIVQFLRPPSPIDLKREAIQAKSEPIIKKPEEKTQQKQL